MEHKKYDVIIIGGGASGTALLYVLAKYTSLNKIALVEKNAELGTVNSNAKNNSQTLHVGDIETHYSFAKAAQVKPAAELILGYVKNLPDTEQTTILQKVPKMVLGVGAHEVAVLENRFEGLKTIFPGLQKINRARIAELEPAIMEGRSPTEPVIALYDANGHAVNFGELAKSLAKNAQVQTNPATHPTKVIDVLCGEKVLQIIKNSEGYILKTHTQSLQAAVVVVDADAYSLGFAKQLGYGENFSLIPIAGSFYFTPTKLQGRVCTIQDSRLPFAAVHGDPDITKAGVTRWGPTARFFPVLESRNYTSLLHYFASSGLHRFATWKSFAVILFEPIRFTYLLKNLLYEFPFIGKRLFLAQIKKIVPSLRVSDLQKATGYGGMRLQRVDTTTQELLLGEGKIIGDKIIFNMTPSPGASVCLHNAKRDAEQIMKFFGGIHTFSNLTMNADLGNNQAELDNTADTSLSNSYAS